jgi:hypothetical protein
MHHGIKAIIMAIIKSCHLHHGIKAIIIMSNGPITIGAPPYHQDLEIIK